MEELEEAVDELMFAEARQGSKMRELEKEMEAMNKMMKEHMEKAAAESDMVKRAIKELNREILEGMSEMKKEMEEETTREVGVAEKKIADQVEEIKKEALKQGVSGQRNKEWEAKSLLKSSAELCHSLVRHSPCQNLH